jgi:hypothetical protein
MWIKRGLAFASLAGLLGLTLLVTSKDDTTNTESALWTFILFASGLGVSFYYGQRSIRDGAAELVRPHARGAARRLVTLGRGHQNLVRTIQLYKTAAARQAGKEDPRVVPLEAFDLACDVFLVHIDGQQQTVNDALEDWREFDPAIVNELQTADDDERDDQVQWHFPDESLEG